MSDKVEPVKGEGKEGEVSTTSTRSATMFDVYWLGEVLTLCLDEDDDINYAEINDDDTDADDRCGYINGWTDSQLESW